MENLRPWATSAVLAVGACRNLAAAVEASRRSGGFLQLGIVGRLHPCQRTGTWQSVGTQVRAAMYRCRLDLLVQCLNCEPRVDYVAQPLAADPLGALVLLADAASADVTPRQVPSAGCRSSLNLRLLELWEWQAAESGCVWPCVAMG